MRRHSRHLSTEQVDSDRVGKMHAGRHELSIRGELAKRQRGFRGRAGCVGRGLSWLAGPHPQRVIVKTLLQRHKPGKARQSLLRHAGYLARDSASRDGQPGVFYDASRDSVIGKQLIAAWAPDRHHFRIIISPERGSDIPDMTAYVRQVMARVEKDLVAAGALERGGKLQWIAINHFNTDNPHAHIVLRGKQENGRDLVIPRAYLAHGMRQRASEVATELLGERTVEQTREARFKEVQAERFTSLDRLIERHLKDGRIDLSPAKPIGFGADDRQLVLGRLQFLESIGLANKERGTWWRPDSRFSQSLHELGARNDIIRQLYSCMATDAGHVHPVSLDPVAGLVIAKGSADELRDDRFILLRDAGGQAHYGRVRESEAYRELQIGSIAELGAGAQRQWQITEQITAVARINGGIYTTQLHEAYLHLSEPGDHRILSDVRRAASRLAFVAGFGPSGVRARDNGEYSIDLEKFQQFNQRSGQFTDVRVIASPTLAKQVKSHAVTWLDRQMFFGEADARMADHPAVREAIQQRMDWLVAQGYAQRESGQAELRPDALKRLAEKEHDSLAQRLFQKHRRPAVELPQGGSITGRYEGIERLHSSKWAVVVSRESVFVSPIFRTPQIEPHGIVEMQRTSVRGTTIESAASRRQDRQPGLWPDMPGGER